LIITHNFSITNFLPFAQTLFLSILLSLTLTVSKNFFSISHDSTNGRRLKKQRNKGEALSASGKAREKYKIERIFNGVEGK
jgi:hypothetical protein